MQGRPNPRCGGAEAVATAAIGYLGKRSSSPSRGMKSACLFSRRPSQICRRLWRIFFCYIHNKIDFTSGRTCQQCCHLPCGCQLHRPGNHTQLSHPQAANDHHPLDLHRHDDDARRHAKEERIAMAMASTESLTSGNVCYRKGSSHVKARLRNASP
jgi:hypothetical protein